MEKGSRSSAVLDLQWLYDTYALLCARPGLYRLNRAIFRLALAGLGILNWRSATLQGERGLLKRLLPAAPHGAVVLDIGANEGTYSDFVLTAAPHVRIHAFEPNPQVFARLSARLEPRGVHCWNFALGDVAGSAVLFDYSDREGTGHASLHAGIFQRIHKSAAQEHQVKVARLDEFLSSSGISEVFLLKIDAEGSERQVLEGLGNALKCGAVRVDHVQLEFSDLSIFGRTFLEDLQSLLPGYRVYRILPRGALIDITDERPLMREIFAFQNLLFSRSNVDEPL
jgi:FkbM family methyltransferase